MDGVDERLRGDEVPDNTVNGAWRTATAVRQRGGKGAGSTPEAAYSVDTAPTAAGRAEPQRARESMVKRFFKYVFLNVSGDVNEIC